MGFINWMNAMHKFFYLLFIYLSDCLYICMDFMEDQINLNLLANNPVESYSEYLRKGSHGCKCSNW